MKSILFKSPIEWLFAFKFSLVVIAVVVFLSALFPNEINAVKVITFCLCGLWGFELLFGNGKNENVSL